MLAVAGYYNGSHIELLEQADVKRNQRVIVTIMDDYVKPPKEEQFFAKTAHDQTMTAQENSSARKQAAFARLEAWRKKYGMADVNFDYKHEVMEAIDEKYGIAD